MRYFIFCKTIKFLFIFQVYKKEKKGGGEEENLESLFKWTVRNVKEVKVKSNHIKVRKDKVNKIKMGNQCNETITPVITKLLLSKFQFKGKEKAAKKVADKETYISSCSGWRGPRTSPSEVPQTRIVKARKSKVCLNNAIVFPLLRYFQLS